MFESQIAVQVVQYCDENSMTFEQGMALAERVQDEVELMVESRRDNPAVIKEAPNA